jgi:hypothetical protein
VLFLVNVLNFYDRQTLAAILEPLRHEFSLSTSRAFLQPATIRPITIAKPTCGAYLDGANDAGGHLPKWAKSASREDYLRRSILRVDRTLKCQSSSILGR